MKSLASLALLRQSCKSHQVIPFHQSLNVFKLLRVHQDVLDQLFRHHHLVPIFQIWTPHQKVMGQVPLRDASTHSPITRRLSWSVLVCRFSTTILMGKSALPEACSSNTVSGLGCSGWDGSPAISTGGIHQLIHVSFAAVPPVLYVVAANLRRVRVFHRILLTRSGIRSGLGTHNCAALPLGLHGLHCNRHIQLCVRLSGCRIVFDWLLTLSVWEFLEANSGDVFQRTQRRSRC